MMASWKRSLGAFALLLCFGLSVPAAGGPLDICLSQWLLSGMGASDCCSEEQSDSDEHKDCTCCLRLEELPDAQTPTPFPEVPDAPVSHLARPAGIPACPAEMTATPSTRKVMIRGPGSPSSYRATLEIWRL